jgi:asparagine synthase (glutamine-hydrolysing)
MCGIAGIWDPTATDLGPDLERMLAVLEHRGPDGRGTFVEGPMGLGHRRLSIIDLDERASQPMYDDSGRYVLTFNGEIYNYLELRSVLVELGVRFRTESDSEVLLAAFATWRYDCLERLNGMFAFAIYDRNEKTLFCARDRVGVKPLVYTHDRGRFAFASEHKALIAAGCARGDFSAEAVYEYVARGYMSQGRSFFEGIEALLPGHALELKLDGSLRIWDWWQPDTSPDEGPGFDEWASAVGSLVEDAVRLRLRSDVPVGAHLSGGLDSSAIVAAAARLGQRLETFTGAFPGEPSSDERQYSRAVADRFGLVRNEVEIDVDQLAESWDRLLWHLDEPVAGPGAFPQMLVCDLAHDRGVKVVLGGQGGDELFGGYLRHRVLFHRQQLTHGTVSRRISSGVALARIVLPELRRVRRTATRVPDSALDPSFLDRVDPAFREHVRRSPLQAGSAGELMLWDLRNYLPALLQVEDRTSMAASLESRTPLLDYRLVELAIRVPDRQRFRGADGKPLLRSAVGGWLPDEVVRRRDKRGFPTPLQTWQSRPALRRLVERVVQPVSGTANIFSPAYLDRAPTFAPSELWTVMAINGWLSSVAPQSRGASGHPARSMIG